MGESANANEWNQTKMNKNEQKNNTKIYNIFLSDRPIQRFDSSKHIKNLHIKINSNTEKIILLIKTINF